MLRADKLQRLNDLAKKAKTQGLTEAEHEERQLLRQEYLQIFRGHMLDQLKSMKIVDDKGNDVTPAKLKLLKQQSGRLN